MVDQSYDRDIQHARGELFRDFALLGQAILSAFTVLTRNRFDAPWRSGQPDVCTDA